MRRRAGMRHERQSRAGVFGSGAGQKSSTRRPSCRSSAECHGGEVDVDDVVDVVRIASRHRDRNRNAIPREQVENVRIAQREAPLAEPQPTQPVTGIRIGAGEVDGKFGPRSCQRVGQRRAQRGQIGVVAGSVVEFDVEPARLLAKRKIVTPVQRDREDLRVVREDRGGAVPLMDVEIDDERPRHSPLRLQDTYRDGGVVEHAETLAERTVRVVRSPREVDAAAGGQCRAARGKRRPSRASRALHHCRRPGKTDAPQRRRVQRAGSHGAHVGRIVRERELGVGRRVGHRQQIGSDGGDALAQCRVLAHRKAMAGREREYEVVGAEDAHCRVETGEVAVTASGTARRSRARRRYVRRRCARARRRRRSPRRSRGRR